MLLNLKFSDKYDIDRKCVLTNFKILATTNTSWIINFNE